MNKDTCVFCFKQSIFIRIPKMQISILECKKGCATLVEVAYIA